MPSCGQRQSPAHGVFPRWTVASVIGHFAPAFLVRYAKDMSRDQRRALQAILQCRTPAMGGHRYVCSCGHEHHAFHSCNHRLCPRCGASDTQEWVGKQLGRLLPVPYYMVTFTVPTQLREVIRGNRDAMELLMRCSSQALAELLADPARCGFERNGFFGVYQSWTQEMMWHPHVHYVVPAVGLDSKWHLKRSRQRRFLLHAQPLATRLRTLLCRHLLAFGLINKELFWSLVKMPWNASVDPAGSGHNAVKYLGQYIHRSVISDGRILGVEHGHVRIRVKNRDAGSFESRLIEGVEFVRRFLQHALPARFHRIRYRGFMHSRGKATLEWLQLLLDAFTNQGQLPAPAPQRPFICPSCGATMQRTRLFARAPPAQLHALFLNSLRVAS